MKKIMTMLAIVLVVACAFQGSAWAVEQMVAGTVAAINADGKSFTLTPAAGGNEQTVWWDEASTLKAGEKISAIVSPAETPDNWKASSVKVLPIAAPAPAAEAKKY